MSAQSPGDATYRRDLGDGLVLRWSTAADTERVITLFSHVFRSTADQPDNPHMMAWIRDGASGRHPLTDAGQLAIVEDTRRGTVVAAARFMRATWAYGGVPFGVGRAEPVATDADYRNKGLVRAVFELLHARSTALGDLLQAITGIPYFYRQFGYEFVVEMSAERSVPLSAVPRLKEGTEELFTLRSATVDDVPLLMALHEHELRHAYSGPLAVTSVIDESYWRFNASGITLESAVSWLPQLIIDTTGEACGYVLRYRARWEDALGIAGLAAAPGRSLAAMLPSVLRGLEAQVPEVYVAGHKTPPATAIRFYLGREHVALRLLSDTTATPPREPYAWYVRVPDLPAFVRHVALVLEQRLAGSAVAGYSGDLRLTFYRGGLRLVFDGGRLTTAEHWQAPQWEPKAQAGFPPLVFTQLLLGHRTIDELRHIFPDAWVSDEARPLLEALFPRQQSWVLPLD